MHLYRYWIRKDVSVTDAEGSVFNLKVYGYANASEAAAETNAEQQVAYIRAKLRGECLTALEESYEQPIREEIIRELAPTDMVTCNRYGALVLNSTSVIFIDVDFSSYRVPRQLSFWQRMFTSKLYRQATPDEATEGTFATANRLLNQSYCRIYRTCKGLRLLVVDDDYKPGTPEFSRLMKVFQADRLYASLCVKQECTRARLTPKPSRIHLKALKHVWPRTAEEDAEVEAWRSGYVSQSKGYAVCHFLGDVGINRGLHQEIIDYHDQMTRAQEDLPLA